MKNSRITLMLTIACLAPAVCQSARAEFICHRITTKGSAYERGLQHGGQLREVIREVFVSGYGADVRDAADSPKTLARFTNTLASLPEGRELLDEMRGISQAAGVPLNQIVALNLCLNAKRLEGCTTVLLPETADGPILVNTIDESASKRTQKRPLLLQTAYPDAGHAMIFVGYPGTVWMWNGVNDAGMAIGGSSGGPGHGGFNADGLYGCAARRYALQFFDKTADAVEFFRSQRQVSKPCSFSILDRAGDAAIVEYASYAVGVRESAGGEPIYASNFFLTDVHEPLSEQAEKGRYMQNARARFRRLGVLTAASAKRDVELAKRIVCDTNGGQPGQICQDNDVMVTAIGGVWMCAGRCAWFYPGHPTACRPQHLQFERRDKSTYSTQGKMK